jgi:hypothetical protein
MKSENERIEKKKKTILFLSHLILSYNFVDSERKEVVKNKINTTLNYIDYYNFIYFNPDKIFKPILF